MKQKLFTILVAIMASICSLFAYDFKSGDLCYKIISSQEKTVAVTSEQNIPYKYSTAYYGLDTVDIPSIVNFAGTQYAVTAIDNRAFSHCDTIQSITIPSSIKTIGNNAFCKTKVKEVHISDLKTWCKISFPWQVIDSYYGDDGYTSNPLHRGSLLYINDTLLTELVVPEDVTIIGNGVFNNYEHLTSVTFHEGITNIGAGAFSGCRNLTHIEIPQSVTKIGNCAFGYCYNLTSVVWNAENCANILAEYTIKNDEGFNCHVDTYLFTGDNITSFTFGSNVEHIPAYLCIGLNDIKSIEIPSSVISVGDSAFYRCDSLESVYISNMSGWCNINFKGHLSNPLNYASNLYLDNTKVTTLNIPSDVTKISNYAFYNFKDLDSVAISDNVTEIGDNTFYNCRNLQSVAIGSNVKKIGKEAFYNCMELESVSIPNKVTSIGTDAFYHVLNINFTGNVSGTPWGAIYKNGYAEGKFVYSSSTKEKLVACSYLFDEELEIPEGVNIIGSNVVSNKNVKTIIVPSSVTSIENYAFNWNNGSHYVTIKFLSTTPPTLGQAPFLFQTYYYSLHVPCGFLSVYKEAWSNFSNRIYEYRSHVQTSVTPSNRGYINIPDSASECTQYTITARPYDHWHFEQWSDGVLDSARIVDGSQDTTITAIFAIDTHDIQLISEDTTKGVVIDSINRAHEYGTTLQIEAVPKYGYHFSHWSDKDVEYQNQAYDAISPSEAASITRSLSEGKTSSITYNIVGYITGTYRNYERSYYISSAPNTGGEFIIFKAQNTANIGDHVKITGAKLYNYQGSTYETYQGTGTITKLKEEALSASRTLRIDKDTTLIAHFEPNQYSIKLYGEHGVVIGNGNYDYLTPCVISVEPNSGYHFSKWSDGNTDNPRTIVLTQDTTFTANFEPNQYTIDLYGENGVVTGSGTYDYMSSCVISVEPNSGYHFSKWSDGNTDNPRTVVLTQDTTFTAVCELSISVSVAEALEIGAALSPNDETEGYYAIEGYVSTITKNDMDFYHNMTFWMTDENIIDVSSNEEGGLYVYRGKPNVELAVGDKVRVEGQIIHYYYKNDIIETTNAKVTKLNTETYIENVVLKENAQKIIINGQILILREEKVYTVTGQEVR